MAANTITSNRSTAERAKEHYHNTISAKLRPEDEGRFLAIDSVTGDYEIDNDDFLAMSRLGHRVEASRIFLMRIGSPVAYRLPSLVARSPS